MKYWNENDQPGLLYPATMSLKKWRQNKGLFSHTKEVITTGIIKNVQGSPSSRKKIIASGNVHLHKGVNNTTNYKYVGKDKRPLFIF